MKKIIVNKIELQPGEMYTASKYPNKGLFEVNGMLVYVSDTAVMYIGYTCSVQFEETAELTSVPNGLSEDFVLKLIAITKNKEKFSDIKKVEK